MKKGLFDSPSRSCGNFELSSHSCVTSSEATWSWLDTSENWRLVITRSAPAVAKSYSRSTTFASSVTFS